MNKQSRQILKKFITKCKGAPTYFINNFCKIRHPKAGVIPFNLFSYQQSCVNDFMKHRFTIFRKCRQSGISTLCGAFGMWYAMFFPYKTILVVSKTERDAKDFLKKNVKDVFEKLPKWMHKVWIVKSNAHEVMFNNGSKITSLNSHPNVLRSHSSSLNIIDESAFMPDMDSMWEGGYPTLTHGGNVIVVSTCNGVGNWYWQTWLDAESGYNGFHPITINWWDMDWEIRFTDEFTGEKRLIAPKHEMKKCGTTDEIEKYGPYWSPWLEGEYRQLSKGGDARGFRQEVLADFVGSGKTVLTPQTLNRIGEECDKNCEKVRIADYVNPFTDAREKLDFEENFWVWKRPIEGNIYSVGVDTATGTGHDFSVIEVIDVMENEQVAELRIKVPPGLLAKMADFIARTYNYAILCVERTGIGEAVCSELNTELRYPNLYRDKLRQEISGRKNLSDIPGKIGFATTGSSKAVLNKGLLDYLEQSNREEGFEPMRLYSHRLYKELQMYIYITEKKTGNEPGANNHDDAVIAMALAIMGSVQAIRFSGAGGLMPFQCASHIQPSEDREEGVVVVKDIVIERTGKSKYVEIGEKAAVKNLMMPYTGETDMHPKIQGNIDRQDELNKFTLQIGGIPVESKKIRPSTQKKHQIDTMRLSGARIHGKKKKKEDG